MSADDETVLHVTPDAPWLPVGGRADVVRRSAPPEPVCIVRLLLRDGDRVYCVPRVETGRLDLPMAVVEADDVHGESAIRRLADRFIGPTSTLRFIGAVRNVVESSQDGYAWPTPFAHFGVWVSEAAPVVDGTWVSLEGADSPLRDRHWFPLVV